MRLVELATGIFAVYARRSDGVETLISICAVDDIRNLNWGSPMRAGGIGIDHDA